MEVNWLKIKHFITHNLPKNHICHVNTKEAGVAIYVMEKSGKSFYTLALYQDKEFHPDFPALRGKDVTHWRSIELT